MSIGADSISENPMSAQASLATTSKAPPPKRMVVAAADPALQPEPR